MATFRIDATKAGDQLAAQRNILFQQFLEHPSDMELLCQIRLIQEQIPQSTVRGETERKSQHD